MSQEQAIRHSGVDEAARDAGGAIDEDEDHAAEGPHDVVASAVIGGDMVVKIGS